MTRCDAACQITQLHREAELIEIEAAHLRVARLTQGGAR